MADRMRISCDMIQGCKIVAADGRVLTEMAQAQGEGFTVATVALADTPPQPCGAQPPSRLPPFAYASSDVVLPRLVEPIYRRGVRRAWGVHMAPSSGQARRWTSIVGVGIAHGLAGGLLARRRR
jgi:hypothetical protein